MKGKSYLILLFVFFGIISLGVVSNRTSLFRQPSEPIYCKYVDEVSNPFIKRVREQYNLRYSGGGGSFINNVSLISLSFDNDKDEVQIDESRVLLVNCIEEILSAVNAKKELQPYLDHFPYSHKGINMSIMFNYNKNKGNRSVVHVFSLKETVYYSYYDPEADRLKDLHQESYEEAVRIVRKQGRLAP